MSEQNREEHQARIDAETSRLMNDWTSGKKTPICGGFFGPEVNYSDAYVDEVIRSEEGTYTKAYGCSFRVKGLFDQRLTSILQLPKYLLVQFPAMLFRRSYLIGAILLFMWFFFRKTLLNLIAEFLEQVDLRSVKHFSTKPKLDEPRIEWYVSHREYSFAVKEIRRAGLMALAGEPLVWMRIGRKILDLCCLTFHGDNTYCLRVQDVLSEKKPGLKEEEAVGECFRLLGIALRREKGIGHKWRFLRLALRLLLLTSPSIRRMVKKFICILDESKVQLDEEDWYFCLGFRSYDFKDKSFEERWAERERLNKEAGVVFLL